MFRPNKRCRIQLSNGNDVYGQPKPRTFVNEGCSIVKLIVSDEKTSVRADSSASRGNARETVTQSIILLSATTQAKRDDIIEIANVMLRIVGIFPRHDAAGRLDHYEVNADIWSQK